MQLAEIVAMILHNWMIFFGSKYVHYVLLWPWSVITPFNAKKNSLDKKQATANAAVAVAFVAALTDTGWQQSRPQPADLTRPLGVTSEGVSLAAAVAHSGAEVRVEQPLGTVRWCARVSTVYHCNKGGDEDYCCKLILIGDVEKLEFCNLRMQMANMHLATSNGICHGVFFIKLTRCTTLAISSHLLGHRLKWPRE